MLNERAEGIRYAANHLRELMEREHGSTDDDVWKHLAWCDEQAEVLTRRGERA